MAKKDESKWNIEDLTDAEICAAIRYLDRNLGSANEQEENSGVVICVSLLILLLGCLVFLWLYWR